jgi:hypothetical protein
LRNNNPCLSRDKHLSFNAHRLALLNGGGQAVAA